LIQSGLLIEKDRSSYDRFRQRIMFPIRDRRGRVIGFGGRALGDETPKYLNSPETEVFKKGKELYGLHELLEADAKPRRVLVVEGYLDVIALAQHGINEAVATLGTSTSTEHVHLLFRFTREIVFCFDGDTAGYKAAWRALEASLPLLREGREIRFIHLPPGEDPDSLIRKEGRAAFERRIGQASPFSDYLFRTLQADLDLRSVEGRAALQKRARELLDRLPVGVFKELMDQRLSGATSRAFRLARSGHPPAASPAARGTNLIGTPRPSHGKPSRRPAHCAHPGIHRPASRSDAGHAIRIPARNAGRRPGPKYPE
jgi:DNA primase